MRGLQDPPASGDDLIGVGEAAAIIGVHVSTVRRWIDDPATKLLPGGRNGPRGWRWTTRADAEEARRALLAGELNHPHRPTHTA
jgi:hypothetical protein